jgi:hypothetical protein
MVRVKRTITGRTATGTMTLGDLRQFIASLDGLPDEASVKARVTFRKYLRELTIEEDDSGFRDFVAAVTPDASERGNTGRGSSEPRQVRGAGSKQPAKETTKA